MKFQTRNLLPVPEEAGAPEMVADVAEDGSRVSEDSLDAGAQKLEVNAVDLPVQYVDVVDPCA